MVLPNLWSIEQEGGTEGVANGGGGFGTEGVAGGGVGVGEAAGTFLCKNMPKQRADTPPKKVRRFG